ncbi:MAG: hypothetical protein OQK66_06355 [Prosthecochloris sp.]|uniref:hypothetical protein n=1 Tax=Prosthecochloris sp. TaxID=290513 RepID=UPI002588B909|nr:hypothetical protein [Prosthecochloris sp.]MCW8798572.1 hypothetical protein [Prosthecochloris sp.]
MAQDTEPFTNIEARIQHLQDSIAQHSQQLKSRASRLKDDLQDELAPEEIIRKYPLQSAAASLIAGVLTGKFIRAVVTPSTRSHEKSIENRPSEFKTALSDIGVDILRSGKDLAFTYFRHYLDNRINNEKNHS